jgi:hypothetical protein
VPFVAPGAGGTADEQSERLPEAAVNTSSPMTRAGEIPRPLPTKRSTSPVLAVKAGALDSDELKSVEKSAESLNGALRTALTKPDEDCPLHPLSSVAAKNINRIE